MRHKFAESERFLIFYCKCCFSLARILLIQQQSVFAVDFVQGPFLVDYDSFYDSGIFLCFFFFFFFFVSTATAVIHVERHRYLHIYGD